MSVGHLAWKTFTPSKKLSVGCGVIAVVSLLVVAGCREECCFVDVTSHVVIQGTTTEADGSPVSGTAIAPFGALAFQCSVPTDTFLADAPIALSDAVGLFQLRLVSNFGPGLYCLDLTATHPDDIQVDTLRNVEVGFRLLDEPPDTVLLQVVFGG